MNYLDVIPLEDAKTYLGVDDTSRDDEIKRMIRSAIKYVEKYTNHVLVNGTRTYNLRGGCARIYDHPIATESDNIERMSGYVNYTDYDAKSVDLEVGYASSFDIPDDLIESCYQVLKFFFYEQEGSGKMPMSITMGLDLHKRFII